MRQLVLVVVLVGAAFLGGAFVNGPGLRWAQTQVLGSLGLGEEAEIATVDLKGPPGVDGSAEKPGAGKAAGEAARGPVAPVPRLAADADPPRPAAADRRGVADGGDAPRIPPPVAASSQAPPALTAPLAAATRAGRATRDPDVARAAGSSAPPPPSPSAAGLPPLPSPAAGGGDRPASLDSLASLMPEPAPAPPEGLAPAVPKPAPAPATPGPPGDDDWTALARKMQALGVSKYSVEGQPGGRVVFACLIPLAGRQAVTQRFEADGNDALQAARAALRRVALWRATQGPASP